MATCHGVGVKNRRGKSLCMQSTCDNTQMLQISKLHRLFGGIDPIIGDLGWMPSNFYQYDATVLDDNGGLDHIHRREAGTEALVTCGSSCLKSTIHSSMSHRVAKMNKSFLSQCRHCADRWQVGSRSRTPRFCFIRVKDFIVNQVERTVGRRVWESVIPWHEAKERRKAINNALCQHLLRALVVIVT